MNVDSDISTKCGIPEANVVEIIPHMYLGNYKSSCNDAFIKNNNIKYIMRITPQFDYDKMCKGVTYVHIPIKDKEMCDKDLNTLFDYTSDMIAKILLDKPENILVHCKRGHHRSAAIIIAFFMKYLKLDYETSYIYISNKRPCALRRDTCMIEALHKYHKYCLEREQIS